ncbi:MAG: hypothetical protein KJ585_04885 [Alphaproteobacteria bacterium]|nr:hypothetical protein [Alphaproteobacteria bacterium]
MFRVDPDPVFTHDVKVSVPVDGGFVPQTFKATFRLMSTNEVATFDLEDGGASTTFLRRVVIGMDEVVDSANEPLPYSDQLRDQLLDLPYVRVALARTYFSAISGNA